MGALGRFNKRGVSATPGTDLSGVERLDLIDVTLLSDAGGRTREVPRLRLRFDAKGVAVRRPDGDEVVLIPWVSLRRLGARLQTSKSGQQHVELGITSDRKQHRFVVPNVSAEALQGALGAMSTRYAHKGLVGAKKGFRLR